MSKAFPRYFLAGFCLWTQCFIFTTSGVSPGVFVPQRWLCRRSDIDSEFDSFPTVSNVFTLLEEICYAKNNRLLNHSLETSQSRIGLANSYRITTGAERKALHLINIRRSEVVLIFRVIEEKERDLTFVGLVNRESRQGCYFITKLLQFPLRFFCMQIHLISSQSFENISMMDLVCRKDQSTLFI